MTTNIQSTENLRVKNLKALFTDARARRESGLFAAEGVKLCCELADSGLAVESVWCLPAREREARAAAQKKNCELVYMSDAVAAKLTDQKTPQGIFAVGRAPQSEADALLAARRVVLLSRIQDPQNVGAIARTADALGYDGLALCGECADLFSPKTLRAAMGAAFRLPFALFSDGQSAIKSFVSAGFTAVAAALRDDAVPLGALKAKTPLLLCIGNESAGLSDPEIALCRASVIPMKHGANSLNAAVAAGLFMWQLRGEDDE